MKLIIDIDEQWRDDMVWENFDKVDELCQAIIDGDIIPDNATNGQVIQTLFKPNRVERTDDDAIVENYDFNKEWWNSPYQKGGKE
jgi:hypothetical protein